MPAAFDAICSIEQHCQRLGIPVPVLTKTAKRQLLDNPWRGNIRELDNVVHAALLTSDGSELRDEHFATHAFIPAIPDAQSMHVLEHLEMQLDHVFRNPPPALLESILAQVVERALTHCESNQVHAAHLLGISRFRLRRLIARP